jgi:L-alanine-DL-glutamate epimerase-like enolase superfamily enzyme
MRRLELRREAWPLRGTFRISRGARREAAVVVAEITDGAARGRGECVPYPRYGENADSVSGQIESVRPAIEAGMTRAALQEALPPGAARNALDCALWDLEAKQAGVPVWRLAGLAPPEAALTALTLSLDTPENMAVAAAANAARPLLKLKLSGAGDLARVRAVRDNAPSARLIVDANEGWQAAMLDDFLPALAELGVELVEQPLPAAADEALAGRAVAIPLCADEACHTRADLARLAGRYQLVNIKLDKAGGLSEALALARAAQAQGFGIMVGCMIGTSLAMAPALLLASFADYVDLDGPLLLARDRQDGLIYQGSTVACGRETLWG